MKYPVLILNVLLWFCFLPSFAQEKGPGGAEQNRNRFTGHYQIGFYPSRKINVYSEDEKLMLEIVGQGKTELSPIGGNLFNVVSIPGTTVEFIEDSLGGFQKFKWTQKASDQEWARISGAVRDSAADGVAAVDTGDLAPYVGKYKLKGNAYLVVSIREENNRLISQIGEETKIGLSALSKNSFLFKKDEYSTNYKFIQDKKGNFNKLMVSQSGPFECVRISPQPGTASFAKHSFVQRSGFTHADTLRGTLTPLRTCYDVLFYGLDVVVEPETKSIRGSTNIRFRAVNAFDKLQVDLFANMKIEKILFHDRELFYTRDCDAVFIQFPGTVAMGAVEEIRIVYSGSPQLPDIPTLSGGFIWFQDKNGRPWIESVCQGSGASLWWPCKDHLSDKPDSMSMSVTIPRGLTEVSNGKFLGKTDLPGELTRYDWSVGYPINNYNVVLYIGDYTHFSDYHIRGRDTLRLNYYCLTYNLEKAKSFFAHVDPMLTLYEKSFGPYPFEKDGFALVESPYGMEHQGAVSMGSISNPINSDRVDTADLLRTLWHESAHEWWGNSVTCKDMADFWIHEAFASYAEVLGYETFYGGRSALDHLKRETPENKEPIIGFYGVNDFHEGDMYPKGSRMLATLRNLIENDSLWFGILRGIQARYKYQTIGSEEIIGYINAAAGTDYTWFFDQYLRHAAIPELRLQFRKQGSSLILSYKWVADVKDFRMPVKVTTAKKRLMFIHPTTDWQTLELQDMHPGDFQVDTDDFYIAVKVQ